ncbi:MAG: DoxX family protein [Gemmatimonadaceae bacterium]
MAAIPAPLSSTRARNGARVSLWILAALFVVAGVLHFVIPDSYTRIVPRWLPAPRLLVYVSGVFEMLGGVGLLISPVRRPAAWGLIALLIAVLPANIQMLEAAHVAGASALAQTLLWFRLPLQPLLMWWVYRSAIA